MHRPKITEEELAKTVIDYLEGGEIYQEVEGHGGIADIVWVCGQIIWVIETKLSLSMSLLSQAENWRDQAHYVIVATPNRRKKENYAAMQFLRWKGVGYWHSDIKGRYPSNQIREIVKPSLNRFARVCHIRDCLCDQQKTFSPAGNAKGWRWTPFQETCRNVADRVKDNPGLTLKELMDGLKHHYASSQSARSSLRHWANLGMIRGVESRREGRFLRFYPREDES